MKMLPSVGFLYENLHVVLREYYLDCHVWQEYYIVTLVVKINKKDGKEEKWEEKGEMMEKCICVLSLTGFYI